jgi:hypothetical protein
MNVLMEVLSVEVKARHGNCEFFPFKLHFLNTDVIQYGNLIHIMKHFNVAINIRCTTAHFKHTSFQLQPRSVLDRTRHTNPT